MKIDSRGLQLHFVQGKTKELLEKKAERWITGFRKRYENHYYIEFTDYDTQKVTIINTPIFWYKVIIIQMVYKNG
jgi:23S rRNA C2498 (ribose-2'-O)-methylase RlmM